MATTLELKSLSIPERLLLVEDIWDSIEEEQHALADHPSVIGEIRARKNKFISILHLASLGKSRRSAFAMAWLRGGVSQMS
jgi:hypothetical protein